MSSHPTSVLPDIKRQPLCGAEKKTLSGFLFVCIAKPHRETLGHLYIERSRALKEGYELT